MQNARRRKKVIPEITRTHGWDSLKGHLNINFLHYEPNLSDKGKRGIGVVSDWSPVVRGEPPTEPSSAGNDPD